MSPSDFCMWLNGCLDIMETKTLNTKQVEMIKEKLATVEGHQISSLHAKKSININTPKQPEIYIPFPTPNHPHPDLGPYPTWQDNNPNWSGVVGQTNSIPLQTVLSPSSKSCNYYYEHHSDIPPGVVVSDGIGTRPAIGTYSNYLPYNGGVKDVVTYSNIPIKSNTVCNGVSFGRLGLSHVTASVYPMSGGSWSAR